MKKRSIPMKKGVTTLTRGVVYFIVIAVFTVNTILLPELAREEASGKVHPPTTWPFFVGAWILSIPVFIALQQIYKILSYIDAGTAFSDLSVKSLQTIKVCAIVFGILIILSVITMVRMADPSEDMPPIFMVGSIFTGISILIATFVAVLQRLLKDAITMKSENDLTV